MLETGIFPDDWKRAKVHPIFKSDERNIPSNYGPISILPAISKIIERAMHTQLLEYFQACNLLTESQSGFRPNHSTCTALISAVYLWLTNLDAGKPNGSASTYYFGRAQIKGFAMLRNVPKLLVLRQDWVLGFMERLKFITII